MSLNIRRVITGHDDQGRAKVLIDETVKNVASQRPGALYSVIWSTEGFPANNDGDIDPSGRKIGTTIPDGTVFQMFMDSTGIASVTIDSTAKTATITGTMVSTVNLRFPDGTAVTLTETVPFLAYAEDNGTPGAGKDIFALTVLYNPSTPGFNQFDLFGSPATFAGILVTGDIVVR